MKLSEDAIAIERAFTALMSSIEDITEEHDFVLLPIIVAYDQIFRDIETKLQFRFFPHNMNP